jgi:hypothetical protein
MTPEEVVGLVLAEFDKATAKFGAFNSGHEGYAVIAEEVDELWDDVKANRIDAACAEAIQVAAMAIRFVVDMTHEFVPAPKEPTE